MFVICPDSDSDTLPSPPFWNDKLQVVFCWHPPAQPKTVYILHNSEQPASCFAITDTGLCLTADTLFDGLMNKLKNYYQQRKNAKMEAKGQRYELGDFILKVGSASLAGSFKGIIVEVG